MKGGDNILANNKLQLFIALIIVGYFGIKIIYGLFFNYYPQKYYNRNINITSNSNNENIDENITLNAYVPGLWNNEMSDFITAMVIAIIVYIFTNASTKSIFNEYGNLNIAFIIGYIIGLGYPPIYTTMVNQSIKTGSNIGNYILLGFSIIVIISAIVTNYNESQKISSSHKINYIIYFVIIVLLIGGLVITRKKAENYSAVTYFNSDGESCTFVKNGVIQTSGDTLNITAPFMAFVIILLFTYEPQEIGFKNLYILIYGILLGIIVSGISYFGMEYFLKKIPQVQCNSVQECIMKKMPIPVETVEDEDNPPLLIDTNLNINNNNFPNLFKNSKISGLKIFLFFVIILLIVYLVYCYITS